MECLQINHVIFSETIIYLLIKNSGKYDRTKDMGRKVQSCRKICGRGGRKYAEVSADLWDVLALIAVVSQFEGRIPAREFYFLPLN